MGVTGLQYFNTMEVEMDYYYEDHIVAYIYYKLKEVVYRDGLLPPHYPVPAIVEWYEICYNLSTKDVELVRMYLGRYEP